MSTLRELKDRITSVEKTKKMTQAMKMVAAAKFKRATQRLGEVGTYVDALAGMMATVCTNGLHDEVPALLKPNNSANQLVIIAAGDRGLCGGFNASVFKEAENYLAQQQDPTNLILIGNKATVHFKSTSMPIDATHIGVYETLTATDVDGMLADVIDQYKAGEIGRVVAIRQSFQSALSSQVLTQQLLPFDLTQFNQTVTQKGDYQYEPSKYDTLSELATTYLTTQLFQGLLESKAGEEGARMAAMEAATSNAGDMIGELKLLFNRSRQAAITTELTEIVSGAAALA